MFCAKGLDNGLAPLSARSCYELGTKVGIVLTAVGANGLSVFLTGLLVLGYRCSVSLSFESTVESATMPNVLMLFNFGSNSLDEALANGFES